MSILTVMRAGSSRRCALVISAGAALVCEGTACKRPADSVSASATPRAVSTEASYLPPPRALTVQVEHDGGLAVAGLASPGATVEIISPEGEQAQAAADARGRWALRLSGAARPRLYAISAVLAGRTVHAEGALIIAPNAVTPAVIVRAGYAASPLGAGRQTGIASVDYDPSGFVAVAGSARPHAQLTLVVDGVTAAVGQADPSGSYALLAASRRLSMGLHQFQVRAPDGTAARQVTLEPPVALTAPYQAWPGPEGWRVEWALNGGGVQTTQILAR